MIYRKDSNSLHEVCLAISMCYSQTLALTMKAVSQLKFIPKHSETELKLCPVNYIWRHFPVFQNHIGHKPLKLPKRKIFDRTGTTCLKYCFENPDSSQLLLKTLSNFTLRFFCLVGCCRVFLNSNMFSSNTVIYFCVYNWWAWWSDGIFFAR